MRIILISLLLIGCNPVKQVLKDKNKLDQVAEVVIRNGYCANDTTIITQKDTILSYDTITHTNFEVKVYNDTVYKIQYVYKDILKTILIRDSVFKYIVDNSRIKLLEADKVALIEKNNKVLNELGEAKEKSISRLIIIIIIAIMVAIWVYIKSVI